MPLAPSAPAATPRTWWTASPPSSKPTAEAAMYSRHTRARPAPTRSTASSQRASRLATHWRSGPRVVLAQRLDVAHLEPGVLHRPDRVADVQQLAVGEHVAAHEGAAPELRAADRGDGVVEEPAAGGQQRRQRREVRIDAGLADVLGHADRGDGLEIPAGEVAVVLEPDLDPVGEAGLFDALAGELDLLSADGDPDDVDAVLAGGVDRHRSPPAADIEQPHAGPLVAAELAAHESVLRRLRIG